MSLFIHSDDRSIGSSSQGVWEFGQTLRGNYRVDLQIMDSQTIPWLYSGQNTMVLRIHDPMNILDYTTFTFDIPTSIGLENDLDTIGNAIQANMQARIDAVSAIDPYANRTITYTGIDTNNEVLVFQVDTDPLDILWTDNASTCNASFNKQLSPDQLNITSIQLPYLVMNTDPRLLEVFITESPTCYITGHGTSPTLLFSTKDTEYTGQTFEIRNDTTSLHIQIRRLGSDIAVPLSASWYLVLTSF